MYRILVFSDSRLRDSFGTAWLAYNLTQEINDSITFAASFNYWQEAIDNLKPHVVVINHIQGKRNKMIADYVKRHGGLVVVLYNEGIIEFDGRAKVFANQRGAKNVDLMLCWNQETAELVGGEAVGCPRFDIYNLAKSTDLIDSRGLFCDKHGLDYDREILLFGSSYPSSKFTYMLQQFHAQNWKDLGNTKAETWRNPKVFAESQQNEQTKFKSIMLATSLERTNAQVVFSPHPMSDIEKWRRWCLDKGITMVDQEYVFNSLNACDLYIGKLGSIAVAEAWLLGKPAVKYSSVKSSASSADQEATDRLNASHINEALEHIMERKDWHKQKLHKPPTKKHTRYLKKWGIFPVNAGGVVATRISELVEERQPKPLGNINFHKFLEVVNVHDEKNQGYVIDAYGNHNKAVRQSDIGYWYERISRIFR